MTLGKWFYNFECDDETKLNKLFLYDYNGQLADEKLLRFDFKDSRCSSMSLINNKLFICQSFEKRIHCIKIN
jgi:hypothetical protein